MNHLPFTEELQEQIVVLTETYFEKALEHFVSFAQYVASSETVKELIERNEQLNKLLEAARKRDVEDLFDDGDLTASEYDGRFDQKKPYQKTSLNIFQNRNNQ